MSDRVTTLSAFAQHAFTRFDNSTKDLKDTEIEWKPVEEANNIRWILTHLSQQWNMGIERTLRGDPNFKLTGWADDYVGSRRLTLGEIMADMRKGRTKFIEGIERLSPSELDVDITTQRGVRKREAMLMTLVSEITHHEGQIAYIRGAITRRRQTDEHFLTQ
jgi:hypothetical protein